MTNLDALSQINLRAWLRLVECAWWDERWFIEQAIAAVRAADEEIAGKTLRVFDAADIVKA